ncbi:MAG: hypothetical protein KDA69_00470 [Planctomycetaceae bacterium]|nr:hypothetical protein [Planctomycetaceae bacterium]
MPFDFQLTDDQFAVLGCLIAIGASFVLMSLSYHANPENSEEKSEAPEIKRLPVPQVQADERKAA